MTAELVACGRARWRIKHEAFNVPKTKCCTLKHNFDPGKHNRAAHMLCELGSRSWREAGIGRPPRLLHSPRTIMSYSVFPSPDDLADDIGV
jgi:hypothetical protein